MAFFTCLFFICQFMIAPASAGTERGCPASLLAAALDPAPVQDPDILPVPIFKAPRVYPESARRDSLQGTVWVEAIVDETGKVRDAKIKSGVRSDLDDAAVSSVRQWTFRPAMQKGKPVNCTIVIPFHFKMRK